MKDMTATNAVDDTPRQSFRNLAWRRFLKQKE